MHHVDKLVARYFGRSASELLVGGLPVSAIADAHGTPVFIYDRSALDVKWEAFRTTFPAAFTIYYSVKANPNAAVLDYFLSKGCGLEIASGGELYQALEAGCPSSRIIFAGPGKTESELESAIDAEIGEIHIESQLELKRITDICLRRNRAAQVGLRVNPSAEAQGGAMRMGGKPAPFGVDEEVLDDVVDILLGSPLLEFRGIHLFAGTQILDHTLLVNQYRKGLEIARRVATRCGRPLHTIDFGGGLGIPYFANEAALNLEELRKELAQLVEEIKGDCWLDGTQLVVEPGRFLVGEAGIYVSRVNDIKVSRGKKFLIVDGGMHHHLAASGNLGQTIKRNYPVALINKLGAPAEETVDVVGPLCTPLDVLARAVTLPSPEVGDLVGIFQSGAYGRSASPSGFLSHPAAAEVWVENGHHRLIRRRGTFEDYLRDQCQALAQ